MTTQQDVSIGFKKETTYGTAVTPDSWVEFLEESLDWLPEYTQGKGMRVGRTFNRSARRKISKESVGGSFTMEVFSKGMGKLLEGALGVGTSTLIAGSSYQQVFTPLVTNPPFSYTIQKAVPPIAGGASTGQTYAGMVCSGFEFSATNGADPTITFNWAGKSLSTVTSLTAASYISGNLTHGWVGASLSIGGVLTPPTTTVLGSMSSADTTVNITDIEFSIENSLDEGGYGFGGAGQRTRIQAIGERIGTGTITAEFTSSTLQAAWRNDTELALLVSFVLPTAISGANYPTFQIAIPTIKLTGEMPKANGGEIITQTIPFEILDGGVAASNIYIAIVTAETAI